MDYTIRLQFSMFTDASSIDSGSRTFLRLVEAFSHDELVPATLQEIMPSGQQAQRLSVSPRDLGITLNVLHNRVDAIWPPLVADGEPKKLELNEFVSRSVLAVSTLCDAFYLKGSRLALISDTVYSPDSKNIVRDRLNPVIYESLKAASRLEWQTRQVFRRPSAFNGEDLNVAVEFAQVKGELLSRGKPVSLNGYNRHIDINTMAENTVSRFQPRDFGVFSTEACNIIGELEGDFQAYILEVGE